MSDLLNQASLVMVPSGYKEDTVYSVVPTDGSGDLSFTRASNGTRVNSAGLVEVTPWNLFEQSNAFSTSPWSSSGASVTITSGQTDPNGGTNAFLYARTLAYDFISQSIPQNKYTAFCTVKKGTSDFFRIADFLGGDAIFNINTGVVTSASSGVTATIESLGNGWYKCIAYFDYNNNGFYLQTFPVANGLNGNGSVYIYQAQANIGSTAKPYFPTTDRLNVPRLTYQNGGGGCPSLLLEKQSTNIVTYSEDFSNADWLKQQSTISANATTSPDGTQNADKLIINNGVAGGYVYQLKSTSSGTVYTGSFYVKAGGVGYTKFWTNISGSYEDAVINLSTGAITNSNFAITPTAQSVGNGWYRVVYTTTSGGGQVVVYVDGGSTSTGGSYTGNGTDGIFLWGAQLEASSYPTSYIPTTSSSATRVADECVKNSATALIGQTEGTIYWEGIIDAFPVDNSFFGIQKTASSFVIRFGSGGTSVYAQAYNGSANLFFETMSYTLGTRIKLAFGYKAGSYAFYANGTQIATGSNATTIPTCDSIMFNSLWGNIGNGSYKSAEAVIFPTRLTNAELASLTTL